MSAKTGRPRVLFLASAYAGDHVRSLNLKEHVERDGRVEALFRFVTGWKEGGIIERLPLPPSVRGRLRALTEGTAFARIPRPDAIWSSAGLPLTPYLWSQLGPLRRPVVLDCDSTGAQREAWAPWYAGRAPRTSLRRAMDGWQERMIWRHATAVMPWSRWAAGPILEAGIDSDRVVPQPPGVDLRAWKMPPRTPPDGRPLRLLFVGGDLHRKGGDVLADVVRDDFAGRCHLDVVTFGTIEESEGVRLHRAGPNSPELRALYRDADLFVLPTNAECFGIATIEAMASGLPVIVGDVGPAREIVDDGVTGWVVSPDRTSLRLALERAVAQRAELPAMGRRARSVAEERFDGERNDRVVVDVILAAIGASKRLAAASADPSAGS